MSWRRRSREHLWTPPAGDPRQLWRVVEERRALGLAPAPPRARRMRRSSRLALALAILAAALSLAGAGLAYLSTTATSGSSGHARAGTVGAPGSPAVPATSNSGNVHVTWAAATLSSGAPVDGYYVTRSDSHAVCGSLAAPVAVLACNDTGAADGTYSYTVTAVYAGWTTAATTGTVLVDTSAPAPTITAPSAYTSSTTPLISGTAGTRAPDATHSGDLPTVTVKLYSGPDTTGTLLQTISGVPVSGGTWTTTPATLPPNARYTAQVTQADAAGNTGSATATFVIDNVSPIVTIGAPPSGGFTNDTTPTFSGSAGQAAAGPTTSADSTTVHLTIYAGATTAGAVVQTLTATASGGSWSVTPATALAANQQYTAQASQPDSAGNTGTSTPTTFVVDTTAPTVTVTTPAGGAIVTTSTPALSGSAGAVASSSTASADSPTVTVSIHAGSTTGGALLQTLTSTAHSGSWSANETPLANGVYTAQATQADGAGNVGTSPAITFTVSQAPAVTLVAPADGSYLLTATPTFSGTAGTAIGDSSTVTVKIYAGSTIGGTLVKTLTTAASAGIWSVATTALPANAQYTARAEQANSGGTVGTSNPATFVIDTAAPAPTIAAPAAYVNTVSPMVSGTAGRQAAGPTASADASTVTVEIYAGSGTGGAVLQTIAGVPVNAVTGAWSTAVSALAANGQYTAQVTQADSAGNTGTTLETFVIDNAAPAPTLGAPTAYVSTVTPAISGTAGTQAATATASPDGGTVTVKIYAGAGTGGALLQTITGVTVAGGSGAWSTAAGPGLTANAQFTAQVIQTDGAGNTGSATFTFVVDTSPPVPAITVPANGASNVPVDTLITGTAGTQAASATSSADGSTVTVDLFQSATATGTPAQTFSGVTVAGGTWSVTPTALSSGTTYTARVTQGDAAGNSGIGTSTFSTAAAVAPLVITGWIQHDESVKGSFSGTGGAPGSTITVSVCTTSDFTTCTPIATATATVGHDGTWLTELVSPKINKGAAYYAHAVVLSSPSQASAVFAFTAT